MLVCVSVRLPEATREVGASERRPQRTDDTTSPNVRISPWPRRMPAPPTPVRRRRCWSHGSDRCSVPTQPVS